mmetsp:Transcript_32221/g.55711  ORF Transcript_32221/g.55711 Transcript_32221/m.55711 type:complete len:335 (-) Transcript_32221:811-1815(-)
MGTPFNIRQRTFSQATFAQQFPQLLKATESRFSGSVRKVRPKTVTPKPFNYAISTDGATSHSQLSFQETNLKTSYNPLNRVFTSPVLGEVKLPKTGFQLAEGAMIGSVFTTKAQKLVKPTLTSIDQLESFKQLKEAISPCNKSKPNYRKCLRRSMKELKNLQVTSADTDRLDSIVCKKPYDKPQAHEFIKACKDGNYNEVERLTMQNRFIVHVYDCMQMTGLHWAVMRNHCEVVSLLLQRKSYVDAIDLSHRTPLHIAARLNLLEPVKLLLSARADPYIKTSGQKLAIKLTTNSQIQAMLHKAMIISSLIWAAPKEKREEIWRQEGVIFFGMFS